MLNTKSLVITILVSFVTIWVTDFLIHGIWLASTYGATKELWRPEEQMVAHMPYMLFGQLLVGIAFTSIFALFVAEKRCMKATLTFAGLLGLMTGAAQIIMYAVQPLPGDLVVKWFVAYCVQALIVGAVIHLVYRLPAACGAAKCCEKQT